MNECKANTKFDIVLDCKRRNSSRLNQTRHRAKRKQHFESLCTGNEQLAFNLRETVRSTLEFTKFVQCVQVKAARVRLGIIEHLYVLFEFGVLDVSKQMNFVTTCMKREILCNGENTGRETFWNQMVLLSHWYTGVRFEMVKVDVCGLTNEIVQVFEKVHLQLNQNVIRMLYPNLVDQYEMVEFLNEKWMVLDVSQVYYFDGHFIESICTNCNWIDASRPLCQSYTDIWRILQNANIDQHLYIHDTSSIQVEYYPLKRPTCT